MYTFYNFKENNYKCIITNQHKMNLSFHLSRDTLVLLLNPTVNDYIDNENIICRLEK